MGRSFFAVHLIVSHNQRANELDRVSAANVLPVCVNAFVCARHGRELMGLKSPVCDPVLSPLLNIKY